MEICFVTLFQKKVKMDLVECTPLPYQLYYVMIFTRGTNQGILGYQINFVVLELRKYTRKSIVSRYLLLVNILRSMYV